MPLIPVRELKLIALLQIMWDYPHVGMPLIPVRELKPNNCYIFYMWQE